MMHDVVRGFRPRAVMVDPISNLTFDHREAELKPTLMRLIDFLKQQEVTALFTSLTAGQQGVTVEDSQIGVSSLMDTWLLLRNVEHNGERNRTLYVLKSRGMQHSNQIREFVLSRHGVDLVEVYVGPDAVLTGSARVAQESLERSAEAARHREHRRKLSEVARRRKAIKVQIAALQSEADAEAEEASSLVAQDSLAIETTRHSAAAMRRLRDGGRGPNSAGRRA
jgi:circadian clock protein KaiC